MAFFKEKLELRVAEAELETQKIFISFSPWKKRIFVFCLIAIIPAYIASKEIFLHVNLGKYRQQALVATASFQNPKLPEIFDINITGAGTGIYSVAAKVSNQNLDLSLDNVGYHFLLYNQAHQQIYDSPAVLFLLPGESKYLILPKVQTAEKITSAEIKFPDALPWQKRLSIPFIELTPSSPQAANQQSPPAFAVQGTVYNNSPYQLNEVDINFILRDAVGKILAASSRAEFTFKPFERRAYVQLWPGIFSTDVKKIDVLPETDVLNNNNLTLPATPVTPSSNLSR